MMLFAYTTLNLFLTLSVGIQDVSRVGSFIASLLAIACEFKLWKASKYLYFYLGELLRKESP